MSALLTKLERLAGLEADNTQLRADFEEVIKSRDEYHRLAQFRHKLAREKQQVIDRLLDEGGKAASRIDALDKRLEFESSERDRLARKCDDLTRELNQKTNIFASFQTANYELVKERDDLQKRNAELYKANGTLVQRIEERTKERDDAKGRATSHFESFKKVVNQRDSLELENGALRKERGDALTRMSGYVDGVWTPGTDEVELRESILKNCNDQLDRKVTRIKNELTKLISSI